MLELHLGFIPDEEMADWCGKQLSTFKHSRVEWANKKLSKYAEFEIIKRKKDQPSGFNIIKIIDPIYSPSAKKEINEKWYDNWGYDGNKLDSNRDCWEKLKPQMTNHITDKTGAGYVSDAKCKRNGSARGKHKRPGDLGMCKYTFCVIVNNRPQHFDKEDLKNKIELEDKYLTPTYKGQKYEMRALYSEYKRKEITQKEYEEALDLIVEQDLGWEEFAKHFDNYLVGKYGESAYSDFRQELVDFKEQEKEVVEMKSRFEGEFDF